jgi:peptide methionine sulfoxide reductase MsrA
LDIEESLNKPPDEIRDKCIMVVTNKRNYYPCNKNHQDNYNSSPNQMTSNNGQINKAREVQITDLWGKYTLVFVTKMTHTD